MLLNHIGHEFSHYYAVLVQGGELDAGINFWRLINSETLTTNQKIIINLAGPLCTYLLMWVG